MFGRSMQLFTLMGFPIRVDLSWVFIAVLITWSLAAGVFPSIAPGLPPASYWWMGIVGALGLFASIVIHELAHAVVARRYDMRIRSITLFIFGGVAELQDEPRSARAEFMVAIAGPIASIALAALFWLITAAGGSAVPGSALWPVVGYLATINAILVVFNMIPAFPLDGGRVLRSILWKWKDDLSQATRTASQIGSAFGIVLIVVGVFSIVSGQFIGGLWWVLIGMFLRSAAQMSYQQVLVRRALQGEPVWRFMQREPHTVPPWATLSEFVDDYVYRFHHKMFPVTQEGQLVGCVNTRQLRDIPKEQWPMMRVEDILRPCSPENTIHPNEDAVSALGRLHRVGESRLMVVERNRLLGVLTLRDLLRFLAAKIELSNDIDADQLEPILTRESLASTSAVDDDRR